jgi:hypothetical protein
MLPNATASDNKIANDLFLNSRNNYESNQQDAAI